MLTFDYVVNKGEEEVIVRDENGITLGELRRNFQGILMFYPQDWLGYPMEDLQQIVEKIYQFELNSGEIK